MSTVADQCSLIGQAYVLSIVTHFQISPDKDTNFHAKLEGKSKQRLPFKCFVKAAFTFVKFFVFILILQTNITSEIKVI